MMDPGYSVDEMVALTIELLQRNGYREDCYVRATVYKSDEAIGVKLHDLESRLNLISIPFGDYIATDRPISCGTVSWRRTGDLSIPSRGKVVGSYVNPAFSKTEAVLNGYEEAIVLTQDGKVSEGSAENLFMVRKGRLVTPGVNADILEGITRAGIIELARQELGLRVRGPRHRPQRALRGRRGLPLRHRRAGLAGGVDRPSARSATVTSARSRGAIMAAYFDAVRGRSEAYRHWVTPVYDVAERRPGVPRRRQPRRPVYGLQLLGLLADGDDEVGLLLRVVRDDDLAPFVLEGALEPPERLRHGLLGAVVDGDDGARCSRSSRPCRRRRAAPRRPCPWPDRLAAMLMALVLGPP